MLEGIIKVGSVSLEVRVLGEMGSFFELGLEDFFLRCLLREKISRLVGEGLWRLRVFSGLGIELF